VGSATDELGIHTPKASVFQYRLVLPSPPTT
jgi:hypothetical protein